MADIDVDLLERALHAGVQAVVDVLRGDDDRTGDRGLDAIARRIVEQPGEGWSYFLRGLVEVTTWPVTLAEALAITGVEATPGVVSGITRSWNRCDAGDLIALDGPRRAERYTMTPQAKAALTRALESVDD